jgi:hypothetical protein
MWTEASNSTVVKIRSTKKLKEREYPRFTRPIHPLRTALQPYSACDMIVSIHF